MSLPNIIIDFETRSECDIKQHGAWKYAQDPTTEVMCMAYKIGGGVPGIWVNPKFADHETLAPNFIYAHSFPFDSPEHPLFLNILEAHNVGFERAIWENIMIPNFRWPIVALEQWRCSAAKCSAAALPRSLDEACKALELPVLKDKEGRLLMMKMCKPRKPLKKEKMDWLEANGDTPEYHFILANATKGTSYGDPTYLAKQLAIAEQNMPTLWHETPEQRVRLFQYCIQDVEAEHCLSRAVRDLDPREQELWFLDQAINERGILVDVGTIRAALHIMADREQELLAEVAELTGGKVTSPRQTAASLEILKSWGCDLPNLQAETVKGALALGEAG